MNEEPTKDLSGKKSFEAQVFARFDAVDARLEKLESRSHDTKPIWERALKEILETRLEMGEVKGKVDALDSKVDALDSKVDTLDSKVDTLDSKVDALDTKVGALDTKVGAIEMRVGVIEGDVASIKANYAEMKRDLKHQVNRRIDLILNFLIEERDDIRDAEDRIKELETKLA